MVATNIHMMPSWIYTQAVYSLMIKIHTTLLMATATSGSADSLGIQETGTHKAH
jgi:hypothetical protein